MKHGKTTSGTQVPLSQDPQHGHSATPSAHRRAPSEDRLSHVMCSKPYRQGSAEFGCGQCLPCKFNRRRLWTGRLLLESATHEHQVFVTLTYDDAHLPPGSSLCIEHYQLWLKSMRVELAEHGRTLRFYLCGEYGDKYQRPHYHACLFGISHYEGPFIQRHWPHGQIHVGEVTAKSIAYNCSHIVKGLTKLKDPRLKGRMPEFQRMSLKPGIGAPGLDAMARFLLTEQGANYIEETGDVAGTIRVHGKVWPIGRYLKTKLREKVGFSDTKMSAKAKLVLAAQIFAQLNQVPREDKRKIDATRAAGNARRMRERKAL